MINIPSTKAMRLRGGRVEARTQPEAIVKTLEEEGDNIRAIVEAISARNIDRVIFVGCGDSYYSGMGLQYAFQQWLRKPAKAVQALEFARFESDFTDESCLVIASSHSGTTERTYEAFMTAKRAGATVIGVTNIPNTPIALETEFSILGRATRVGWPTQSTTAQLAAMYWFALELAESWKTLDEKELKALRESLLSLPGLVARTVEAYDEPIRKIAYGMKDITSFFFVGGGPGLAVANLGAAKIKEYSEDHAMVLELEEFHHYDSVKENEVVFLVAPNGQAYDRLLDTAEAAQAAGARVFAMVEEGDTQIASKCEQVFEFPRLPETLIPIPYVLPLHLFADHLSVIKGCLELPEDEADPEE